MAAEIIFIGTNLLLPVTANSVNLLLRAPFGARSDFRIFLNFSLLFKAGFAPCHGYSKIRPGAEWRPQEKINAVRRDWQ